MKKTHNEDIMTDELFAPGYVWYRCTRYNLPDNTMGQIGYHVVYRPLCKPDYKGTEIVTDEMMRDTREHYSIIEMEEEEGKKMAKKLLLEEIEKRFESVPRIGKPGITIPCRHCGTYCYGDCQAHIKKDSYNSYICLICGYQLWTTMSIHLSPCPKCKGKMEKQEKVALNNL